MIFWKKSLIALSVSALALPAAAFAAAAAPAAGSPPGLAQTVRQKAQAAADTARTNAKKAIRESANLSVHKEMYFTLLSEKYTPSDTEQWKAAFAERERLLGELKALKLSDEEKAAIKETRSAELQKLRQERKDGTLDKEALQARIQELKDSWQGLKALKTDEWDGTLAGRQELHKAFTDAIASGDSAAISAVLPQLLAQTQKENSALADVIAKLQAELQNTAAPAATSAQ